MRTIREIPRLCDPAAPPRRSEAPLPEVEDDDESVDETAAKTDALLAAAGNSRNACAFDPLRRDDRFGRAGGGQAGHSEDGDTFRPEHAGAPMNWALV
jgi:hypothetical protein